jgi:hypothetical protein
MRNNRFGIASALAGFAAVVAISAAPSAASASTAVQPIPTPGAGTVALPPGGPADILPGNQILGGANPYVPFGPDPFVPYGVWTP